MPRRGKSKSKKASTAKSKKRGNKKSAGDTEPSQAANASSGTESYTVEQLLTKADECAGSLQTELALKFCERAMQIDHSSVAALEKAGKLYLENNQPDESQKCFAQALILQPGEGYLKYMYLGQLTEGLQAVDYFKKGLALMEAALAKNESPKADSSVTEKATCRDVSNGYLSMAELFLTDLCDEEVAQTMCTESIEKAIQSDPSNPAAYQLKAEYLLVIQEREEAKSLVERSVSLWWPQLKQKYEDIASIPDMIDEQSNGSPAKQNLSNSGGTNGRLAGGDNQEAAAEEKEEDGEGEELDIEMKMKTIQILTEAGSHQLASDILELLLQWNDDSVQIWYMLGLNCYLQENPEDHEDVRHYLQQALKVAKKHNSGPAGEEVEDMCVHCREILEQLGTEDPSSDGEEDIAMDAEGTDNVDKRKTIDENYETSSDEDEEMVS